MSYITSIAAFDSDRMDKPYHRPVPVPSKPLPSPPPTRDDIRQQLGWDLIQRRRDDRVAR